MVKENRVKIGIKEINFFSEHYVKAPLLGFFNFISESTFRIESRKGKYCLRNFFCCIFRPEMDALRKLDGFYMVFLLFFATVSLYSQSKFSFEESKDTKDKVHFQLVKGLMIVPVEINGVELSFLLDTGVEKTILFSLENRDSLELFDVVPVQLRGLGQGQIMTAYRSANNHVQIGKAVNNNLSVYLVFDQNNNISLQLGIPVHGIIGHDFFKDFVVEVNYEREFIKFHEPSEYDRNPKKWESLPLQFFNAKPYLETQAMFGHNLLNTTLLIDTGASDALWFFPNDSISVPQKNFVDFLGAGLSGHIYGRRGKIPSFSIGKFTFKNITAAFPDSLAVGDFKEFTLKDGLIGAEILRRFDLVIDYPKSRLLLRPNSFFNDPFYYDMSGLVLRYDGMQVVEDYRYIFLREVNPKISFDAENNFARTPYKVILTIVPKMEIESVRPGSPAAEVGLKKGDILLVINGKPASDYTLIDLSQLFRSQEGKRIKLEIERNGAKMTKKFRLRKFM